MYEIERKYEELCRTPSDIFEHLPTLKKYAEQSDIVVELGVRGIVSTWAFLAAKPKIVLSYDIVDPREHGADIWEVTDAANQADILWSFIKGDSLEVELPKHDLLFIDTLHTYDQLTAELERHSSKAGKFIIMHDTNLDGDPDRMRPAVNDFLDKHQEWEVAEQFENCNGLTILKRV